MNFDKKKLTSVLLLHFLRTHHNKTNFKRKNWHITQSSPVVTNREKINKYYLKMHDIRAATKISSCCFDAIHV